MASDAVIFAEGQAVGRWLHPVYTRGPVRRVAFVGGLKYDRPALELFMRKLRVKYPDATVVTGSARGAEQAVQELAGELGLRLEIAPSQDIDKLFDVNTILIGSDVIVTVGTPTGQRAARAKAIHDRVDAWTRDPRPLVNVAMPVKASVSDSKAVLASGR